MFDLKHTPVDWVGAIIFEPWTSSVGLIKAGLTGSNITQPTAAFAEY
jgi:hypothetical protein